MKLPISISLRYLLGKKTHHAINFISGISVAGILTGTAALIIILSVFNGFQQVIQSLYNVFDPDIKITAIKGKVFIPDEGLKNKISSMAGVAGISETIEDNALFRYRNHQHIGLIKGVDQNYQQFSQLGEKILQGEFVLNDSTGPYAVVGAGVAYYLNMGLDDAFYPLEVFVPSRKSNLSTSFSGEAFNSLAIRPSALFSVQQDFDISYVITPLSFARKLLEYSTEVSALEVYLEPTADLKSIQKNISQMLGSEFKVANRYQQQASLYKIMRTEKYAIFIILAFILIVATFTLIGSLSMVISEKQRDIAIYMAMGAPVSFIRKVFLYQGLWISMAGGIGGILLGAFICFLQQTFGFVKINTSGSSFVISQYPVEMQGMDFLVVFVFVIIIGIIASWIPARRSTQKSFTTYLRVE
ncbi:MAG TPA: hypothetical protein DCX03_10845 [Bacteroidales bacterium]|jgi:lipoprotein-releasing system permease protein|nr:hypothetical protein [Bacteroidales bacterium]